MRIGILTLPLHSNYGGVLQAWALQTVLEKSGHVVDVFNLKTIIHNNHSRASMPIVYAKRLIKNLITKSYTPILFEKHIYAEDIYKNKSIYEFTRSQINVRVVKNLKSIPINDYDCIIVGSDQIWRKDYIEKLWNTKHPEDAFLCDKKYNQIIKLAYAASLGNDDWEFNDYQTNQISQALRKFKFVSVRETSGTSILNKKLNLQVDCVLDPTMLLTADDYIQKLALKISNIDNGCLVSYILDPNEKTTELVNTVLSAKHLQLTELNKIQEDGTKLPIEVWVENIASADIVITDSFHGCVFSLIFRKPLIFVGNDIRGNARFETLIDTFGLNKNMVKSVEDFDESLTYRLPNDIDSKIENQRKRSLNLLMSNLL